MALRVLRAEATTTAPTLLRVLRVQATAALSARLYVLRVEASVPAVGTLGPHVWDGTSWVHAVAHLYDGTQWARMDVTG